MIIDTHTHVVSGDRERYPLQRTGLPGGHWVDVAPDASAFAADLAAAGVDRAVLVQPNGAYRYDNSYMIDSLVRRPELFHGAATVDMQATDAAAEVTKLADAGVGGLRVFSIPTPATSERWLDGADAAETIDIAVQHNMQIAICVLPEELDGALAVAKRNPDREFVFDHAAFVELVSDNPQVEQLRAQPNVVLKITTHVIDHHGEAGIEPGELLATLADWFGEDRLLWGSDWAQTHDRPYAQLVQLARDAAAILPAVAAGKFLGGNAARLWEGRPSPTKNKPTKDKT